MKIKEIAEKYSISVTALRYYEKIGLFDNVQRVNHIREYNEEDVQRLSLILSLKEAGLHMASILKYIELFKQSGTFNERISILKKQRNETLDTIHHHQKSLDSLDNMIYQLKNKEDFK